MPQTHRRLDALLALSRLDALPRSGWLQHGVARAESIAGHILGSAHLALALAPEVVPSLELGRLLALVLIHDAPEALTGDLPRSGSKHLPPGAKAQMEAGAAAELFQGLGPHLLALWQEYADRSSREARFAALCDRLQLGLSLLGYLRAGSRGLEDFSAGLEVLDCSEFAPADALRRELLLALRALPC